MDARGNCDVLALVFDHGRGFTAAIKDHDPISIAGQIVVAEAVDTDRVAPVSAGFGLVVVAVDHIAFAIVILEHIHVGAKPG